MFVTGQKNIFLQKHQNLDFTPKEGPMVDDRVLPGSKKHQLPGSKVKKTFFTKTSKSRFHAEGRSNGGRPCPSGVKKTFLLKVCLFVCDKLKRTSYDRKMFMEFVQYT